MKQTLALNASAGSGKTFALSVRYIALLFLGANPSSIVALTFTKKAANEMKERIYETLLHLETKETELQEVAKLIKKSEQETLALRHKVFKKFSQATLHIETIDAFFGKILRKFSLHMGLTPDFQSTTSNDQIQVEEIFTRIVQKDTKAFQSLISFMYHERLKFRNIFELFELFYEKVDGISPSAQTSLYPTDIRLLEIAKRITFYLEQKGASKTAINMFNVQDAQGLMQKTFWSRDSLEYRTFSKVYTKELDELFLQLKDEYAKYCKQKERYILGELYGLFHLYKKVKIDLAKKTNELTFSDVTKFVYTLLREKIGSDFLYFRLDANIEHLLIDEFQDTNVLQFDILKPIIEEIISGIGTGQKSFFYVGDTKQSIYRFRGGSKALFDSVATRFHIPKESMGVNYRSDGVVVEFINETFSQKLQNYTHQEVKRKRKQAGYAAVLKSDEISQKVVEAVDMLLGRGVNSKDIAILTYTNKDALSIKEALIAYKSDMEVSFHSTKSIFTSRAVRAMMEYVKYLYFGYELCGKNVLVLLGRSFEESLERLQVDWQKPLEENFIQIAEFLKLDGMDKDILHCIEIASEYERIEEFLFALSRLDVSSLSQEVKGIKVLTIHKSKGLEFPFVIVADRLGRQNSQKDTLLYEYKDERLSNIYLRMRNREHVDDRYEDAKIKEQELIAQDLLHVQYVAFTRARNALLVICKNQKSSFEALGLSSFEKGTIVPIQSEQEDEKPHIIFEPMGSYGLQENQKNQEDDEGYVLRSVYFGRALHYLLELMGDFTDESLKKAYEGTKNRYGTLLNSEELEDIYRRTQRLLCDELFCRLTHNGTFYKEQPLRYQGEKKQLDLLVEHDDKMVIIDYKSSENEHEENEKQVLLYKKALEKLQPKNVEAWLFYLRKDEVVAKNLA